MGANRKRLSLDSKPIADQPVALITGSTSGIGKATAERLLHADYYVLFHSRSSVSVGEQLAKCHQCSGYVQCDLADPSQLSEMCAEINAQIHRLDVLINCAAASVVIPHGDLSAATSEIWQTLYQINVIAPWLLISNLQPLLLNASKTGQTSSIINISSHAGVRPKGASVPYSVSKAALNHMTALLAKTLAPNIRVNGIAPGLTQTPMTSAWQEAQQLWKTQAPMGRQAQPEEIADLAWFLIQNPYITGEIILMDGGLNLT